MVNTMPNKPSLIALSFLSIFILNTTQSMARGNHHTAGADQAGIGESGGGPPEEVTGGGAGIGESGGGIFESLNRVHETRSNGIEEQFIGETGGGIPASEIQIGGMEKNSESAITPMEFSVLFYVENVNEDYNPREQALSSLEFKNFISDLEKTGLKLKDSDFKVEVNQTSLPSERLKGKQATSISANIEIKITDQTLRWKQTVQDQIKMDPNTGRAKNCGTDVYVIYTLRKIQRVLNNHRKNIVINESGGNECIWHDISYITVDEAPIGSGEKNEVSETTDETQTQEKKL